MTKNHKIEVLRAYSILLVIIAHLPYLFPDLGVYTSYFWLGGGVDLFFCISGYLIASSLFKSYDKKHTFISFYFPFFIKRIYRLWPAAIFWSIVAIVCSTFFNESNYFGSVQGNITTAIAAIFQVVNFNFVACEYFNIFECKPNALRVYWSLSLEEQFYFIFPIILFYLGKRKSAWIALILILLQLFLYRPWPSPLWFFRTDAIALGVLIAYLHHIDYFSKIKFNIKLNNISQKTIVLVIFLLLFLIAREEIIWFYNGLVVIVSGILVLLASFNKGFILNESFIRKILVFIGSRSYSLYLTHMLGIFFIREIFFRYVNLSPSYTDDYLMFLIPYILIVSLFTEFSYRYIEDPLRKKGRLISKNIAMNLKKGNHNET